MTPYIIFFLMIAGFVSVLISIRALIHGSEKSAVEAMNKVQKTRAEDTHAIVKHVTTVNVSQEFGYVTRGMYFVVSVLLVGLAIIALFVLIYGG